ncbi:hypothetical protein MEO42_08040, partial [Dolichospermum sp. ST_sed6]|nr:hypothetical protein [Dolichospermum sp. ST_sed6]MDD1471663.1 hypothetical protein [Dolichospermum sp. ST_sed4]
PVLVLLAGKMPALQEILGYFLNWKSLSNVGWALPTLNWFWWKMPTLDWFWWAMPTLRIG